MKGYLIIPLWIAGNVATTMFLFATLILSYTKKNKAGEPYFEIRSIASVNK